MIFRASCEESHLAIARSSEEHTEGIEHNALIPMLGVCCRIGCLV